MAPPYQQGANPAYQGFPPATQYASPGLPPQQFQAGAPGQPPHPYPGTTPSPIPFAQQQQQQQQPARTHTPPQTTSSFPTRPGGLPAAPNLPQRPAFGAPPVNSYQMQQMHPGQLPVPPAGTVPNAPAQTAAANGEKADTAAAPIAASVDDLISGAAKEAEAAAKAAEAPKAEEAAEEKAAKKEKDKAKPTRLVYSDNEVSPEEKMARLPRYAFVPDRKEDRVLVEGTTAAVAGIVTSEDDVIDRTH